jgi:hypothetical protein
MEKDIFIETMKNILLDIGTFKNFVEMNIKKGHDYISEDHLDDILGSLGVQVSNAYACFDKSDEIESFCETIRTQDKIIQQLRNRIMELEGKCLSFEQIEKSKKTVDSLMKIFDDKLGPLKSE